ncbi:MAG: cellulose synthase [Bauldia sp.]|nr:cellulose synthase [Bauldia sp.]
MKVRPSQILLFLVLLVGGFFVLRGFFSDGGTSGMPTVATTQQQVPVATISVVGATTPQTTGLTPTTTINVGTTPTTTINAGAAAPTTAPATVDTTPVVVAANGVNTAIVPEVDTAALRYFARQGDTVRLQAEIARLQALYPTWTPPADPLATPVYTDTEMDRMWALYSEARYAEVRTAIAGRQQREPGWSPPAALLDLLVIGEARDRLVAASNSRRYEEVIVAAAQTPSLLVCLEMDVMWRVAEAFALTGREPRALDVYTYILQNCDGAQERFATMQKALGHLEQGDFRTLYAYERTGAAGSPEFDGIRTEEARTDLVLGAEDDAIVLTPDEIARMEAAARAGDGPSDALLLGWYYQLRDEARRSEPWFRLAFQREATAEAAQGLALALIDLNRADEAEDIVYAYRDDSDEVMAVYLAAVATYLAEVPIPDVTPAVLRRMAETVGGVRDGVGARQLGWYAYNLSQVTTAVVWFQTSLAWLADNEEAAYGLGVSYQRLQDTANLNALVQQWGARSLRIRALTDPDAARQLQQQGGLIQTTVPVPTVVTTGTRAGTTAVTTYAAPVGVTYATVPAATPAPTTGTYVPVATATTTTTTPATTTTGGGGGGATTSCSTSVNPETLSPAAALNRAWCLMELNRPTEAAAAFGVALRSTSAATRSDAAYGQSLAYLRLGVTDRAAIAATQAEMTPARADEVQANILSQRAVAAYQDGRYSEALRILDERARIAGEQNDLMIIRGYSYMYMGNLVAARWVFGMLANAGVPDARTGLAEVERRSSIFVE